MDPASITPEQIDRQVAEARRLHACTLRSMVVAIVARLRRRPEPRTAARTA